MLRTSAPLKGALGITSDPAMIEYLTWPAVVLVVALLGMLMFKQELRALIRRTEQITKDGVTFDKESRSQKYSAQSDGAAAEELLRTLNSQILTAQEQSILEDLGAKKILDPEQREKVLVRFLAVWQLIAAFEQINARIFSSQVRLMHAANDSADGLTRDEIRPYYEFSIGDHSDDETTYGIEGYVKYLITSHLLVQEGDRYKITPIGRELLVYQIHHGHPGPKWM